MNEVEKMYENAEPNRNCNLYKHFTECPMKHTQCEDCENFVYPPFTAEKQLELIKWLINEVDYITMWHFNNSKKPYDFEELDKIYISVTEASKDVGICISHISNCLHGRIQTAGGYHWEFINEVLNV